MNLVLKHTLLSAKHHPLQALSAILMVLGALSCVFTPNNFIFKQSANYTDRIAIGYLLISMLFLVLRKQRLMFVGLACCAVLCLFLKNALNTKLIQPMLTSAPKIKVAQFTISASEDEKQALLDAILNTDADIIGFQEVNPYWHRVLATVLATQYPYSSALSRVDIFGLAVFSKKPILKTDTFFYKTIPNLAAYILQGTDTIQFVVSHTEPPFNRSGLEELKAHLNSIAAYCTKQVAPLIAVGNYNAVLWSDEIQQFRRVSRLEDSRSGYMANYPEGKFSLFNIPIDHIFFSRQFRCIDFKPIEASNIGNIGIGGMYQLDTHVTQ
ncbi:MAG: endonuclease/exonuclease/phosphatase family protein [Saprospiraceae bacterium]|nr:endonuclease/exonuclease/phosphatase family protein [Saprospiraceae bacterium]MBP7680119.1 endonuclease/exonuclease/phosphatase family protein [Saprospiraceae bacterium]